LRNQNVEIAIYILISHLFFADAQIFNIFLGYAVSNFIEIRTFMLVLESKNECDTNFHFAKYRSLSCKVL